MVISVFVWLSTVVGGIYILGLSAQTVIIAGVTFEHMQRSGNAILVFQMLLV